MTYKEKKRSMFLGLPWTFTTYTVTDEFISNLLPEDLVCEYGFDPADTIPGEIRFPRLC